MMVSNLFSTVDSETLEMEHNRSERTLKRLTERLLWLEMMCDDSYSSPESVAWDAAKDDCAEQCQLTEKWVMEIEDELIERCAPGWVAT